MQPVFIISPETAGMDAGIRQAAHEAFVFMLNEMGLAWKPVLGVYKGSKEGSYVIAADEVDIGKIETLRLMFGQECFMYVDSRRFASLHYDKHVEYLGQLRDVSPDIAKKRAAYTTDGETYWVVR